MPTLIYTRHCCLTVQGKLLLSVGESKLKKTPDTKKPLESGLFKTLKKVSD